MSDAGVRRCSLVLAAAALALAAWLPAAAQQAPEGAASAPLGLTAAPLGAAPEAEAPPAGAEGRPAVARTVELAATVGRLRASEAARQAQLDRLHDQVTLLRAQVEWHEQVLPWIGAALVLMAGALGLSGWWSLRRRPASAAVHRTAMPPVPRRSPPEPQPMRLVETEDEEPPSSDTTAAAALPATAPPAGQPAPAEPPRSPFERSLAERPEFVSSTRPVPQLFSAPPAVEPALTADALIDLEQQADFFLALGQHEAAVERLIAELRTVEGRSPMPWLKLLDIHRRQGDQGSYQRALDRFRQRFGPHGDEWQEEGLPPRLLDDYPGVVHRIQQAWSAPQEAMALLERLLGGCERGVVLSLQASQEALLLYQVARSFLPGEAPPAASDVDLLLPMDPGAEGAERARPARDARLDLDLSSDLSPLR
ncbi:hypothetical protein V4F39_01395 [Aquincola sp. MAHUQ-54]|uniref:Tetratricopeptide repeat protein n=1 Tax=Aquincola agrisoli TaxID=3119538 RepID=A0AAW9QAX8_9BURK